MNNYFYDSIDNEEFDPWEPPPPIDLYKRNLKLGERIRIPLVNNISTYVEGTDFEVFIEDFNENNPSPIFYGLRNILDKLYQALKQDEKEFYPYEDKNYKIIIENATQDNISKVLEKRKKIEENRKKKTRKKYTTNSILENPKTLKEIDQLQSRFTKRDRKIKRRKEHKEI